MSMCEILNKFDLKNVYFLSNTFASWTAGIYAIGLLQ